MKKILTVAVIVTALLMSVTTKAQNNPFGFGVQAAYNVNKAGVGLKFSYDFTKMCRFSLDGNYYFYNANRGQTVYNARNFNSWNDVYHIIPTNTAKRTVYGGRQFDINANVNIVFGEKNFHFYLVSGLAFAYGLPALTGLVTEHRHFNESGTDLGYGIDEDDVHNVFGIGLNLGCGIEYQITPALRANLEQMIDLSLPNLTAWMAKLGVTYCL